VTEISALGHVGIWVQDVARLREFYRHVLGLTVTDSTDKICFLSSQPDVEHHQLVLVQRREGVPAASPNQVSWRMKNLASVLSVHRALLEQDGARIEGTVTHGNAISVYFYDPEGNRGEAYWQTGWSVPQPYRRTVNFGQSEDLIIAEARELIKRDGIMVTPAG
jgi:catechol-2,3-dioxygenase